MLLYLILSLPLSSLNYDLSLLPSPPSPSFSRSLPSLSLSLLSFSFLLIPVPIISLSVLSPSLRIHLPYPAAGTRAALPLCSILLLCPAHTPAYGLGLPMLPCVTRRSDACAVRAPSLACPCVRAHPPAPSATLASTLVLPTRLHVTPALALRFTSRQAISH